eukprot:TRINITY_DN45326_c0_g1_i1.p1 TRINITY_DN45326_c0_g1~~TRINITY_DN45326_c0_g1_i1.p1  ORF type:complete len:706 (-),score=174.01 TRINITY_DN45326_c0_g1_i1:134-2251(-)
MAPISAPKCPFHAAEPGRDKFKPPKLNLKMLSPSQPIDYDYPKEFEKLDVDALKADCLKMLKDSKPWWPADYGHYGPFLIRLAWHSAGTYRVSDGRGGARGGNIRFPPLDSWPDNGNLDKAKRLLWPIKQKYGKSLSWGDLMIFAANVGMEDMGFTPLGFAFGRKDIWALEEDIYWGGEEAWLDDSKRHGGVKPPVAKDLEQPLGASQMGLIYVNPEGPGGMPDPMLAAQHIRETFGRMAMNDEETVALIAGGHTFGKGHGAAEGSNQGPEPQLAAIEEQGFGWTSKHGSGRGSDTITSGLEGAWTSQPTKWDNGYLETLYKYEWELQKAPSGAQLWRPKDNGGAGTVPDAHIPDKTHQPIMYTTDIALRTDPEYKKITERWAKEPEEFRVAFQEAWFKLTHRDMGIPERYLGKLSPPGTFLWQDLVPKGTELSSDEVKDIKAAILETDVSVKDLVHAAWSSASTFRGTDLRGGANGARIRLAPQKDWAVNNPKALQSVLSALTKVQEKFTKTSLADLIVLGGCAAIEKAARARDLKDVVVPFTSGRGDATQDATDEHSFKHLEPVADAFRNYNHPSPNQMVDRATLLGLTSSEMTALIGGLRVLGVTDESGKLGVLTDKKETLSNDFFVNLLSMDYEWKRSGWGVYDAAHREEGTSKWQASECDLVFGSNAELRAIAEYYAQSNDDFVKDFIAAWAKVMDADRV